MKALRVVFIYQILTLGGVEVLLKERIRELMRRGIDARVIFLENMGGESLFSDLQAQVIIGQDADQLERFLAAFEPDWILIQDTPAVLPLVSRLAAQARVVYEVHTPYPASQVALRDPEVMRHVTHILVPSPSQRDLVHDILVREIPVEVSPSAVADYFFQPATFAAPRRPVLAWVGRLDAIKNWRAFIEIARTVKAQQDVDVWLVGGGHSPQREKGALQEAVERAHLVGAFEWLPSVPHSEMPALYQSVAASGGCLLQTSWAESFGLSILEGMASGCPVVVSHIVGLRNLVEHDVTGWFYPPYDTGRATELVLALLQDPARRLRVAHAAAAFAAQFTVTRSVDRLLEILNAWSDPRQDRSSMPSVSAILPAHWQTPLGTDDGHNAEAVRALRIQLVETMREQTVESHERDAIIHALQAELHAKVGERDQLIRSLQDELHSKVGERDVLIRSLQAELQSKVSERDGLIRDLQEQLQRPGAAQGVTVEQLTILIRDPLEQMRQSIERVERELETRRDAEHNLRTQMDQAQQEVSALRRQLAEQEERLQVVSQENAAKEPTIQTLSDQVGGLRRELYQIQTSKWWKLAGVYWSVLQGVKALGRRVVPLPTRRWLNTQLRRRPITGALPPVPATPGVASRAHALTTAPSAREKAVAPSLTRQPDVICFPIIYWHFRFQRPQQLMTRFAEAGHRVYYLQTGFLGLDHEQAQLQPIAERIFEVGLPGESKTVIYSDHLAGDTLERASAALDEMIRQQEIVEAVCVVQYPFWEPLVQRLRERYGWKIVYDCMDDLAGFGTHGPTTLQQEERLLRDSDLVVVSSNLLYQKVSTLASHCVLIPNAGDYSHFSRLPERSASPIGGLPQPVVGYYGAIAEWFDVEAVRQAAQQHPDWSFVLIGHTFGAQLGALERLPNVHRLGEKPYAQLPAYLAAFDVCVIPFLRLPLTEATNPVKVFEYLAAGKPVVARDLPELEPLADVVTLYRTAEEFTRGLEQALQAIDPDAVARRQAVAKQNTWDMRYRGLQATIEGLYEKVSIIIISYNGLEHTHQCVRSILDHTQYPNFEVIIVDNASNEKVKDYLRQLAQIESRVRVVFNERNLGFAAANNIGLALAQDSQFLILLNNDTVVPPLWLSRLIRYARRPAIGLVGPVTNWTGNEAKIDIDYEDVAAMPEFARRVAYARPGQSFDIAVLAMYCVAMRRDVYETVGPLDERFGVGMFEDDDYARRVRAAGYRVICAEDVFIHHHGMASFAKLGEQEYRQLFERNRQLYEEKWGEEWVPHVYRPK